MKMNLIKMVTVAVAGLMFSGCASLSTENPPAAGQAEPVVINDRQIIRQMTAKASRMMDSDSVVGMKTLIERLKKEPKVNLQLPKTDPRALMRHARLWLWWAGFTSATSAHAGMSPLRVAF